MRLAASLAAVWYRCYHTPMDTTLLPTSSRADLWYRKVRYHHGNLRSSALARGRQIVTLHGPCALSLRGLARDLGVTAVSLVRQFGNLAGMRAAVAESVLEKLQTAVGLTPGRRTPLPDVAGRWVAFAAGNANLYRLLAGEGWHLPGTGIQGLHGMLTVSSPRRALDNAVRLRTRRVGLPRGDSEKACYLASMIHGLALARIDGVGGAAVHEALARALTAA